MRRTLCAIIVLAGLVQVPAAAAAAPSGKLTPRLQQLTKPSVAEASRTRRASELSLPPKGAGALQEKAGKIAVTVRFAADPAGAKTLLEAAGADIEHVSPTYSLVVAYVAPEDLEAVAKVPGVLSVAEALAPEVEGWSQQTCRGATTSGGDAQLRADVARRTYGVNGAGVKVGVISDSYAKTSSVTVAEDIGTGDLPGAANLCGFSTGVQILDDSVSGADEGRAMAKIVHDIAPGASLAFATAGADQTTFASNITNLKNAGSGVIVDDITFFDEPFFQDGPIATAANAAAAGGSPYLSAAGNPNNVDSSGRNISGYEATFRPTPCPAALGAGTTCHNFNPGGGPADPTLSLTGSGNLGMILGWSEPWNAVSTNYDLYILDSTDTTVLDSSTNVNATTGRPFEFASSGSGTHHIVVKRTSGADTPRFKLRNTNGNGLTSSEYPSSSGGDVVGATIFGHKGTTNVYSVAAAPFNDNTAPETYSARGPMTLAWQPVPSTTALASVQTLNKPDFTASDCGVDTFFGGTLGAAQFCGTSAAAPHAAGVAALIRQAKPAATVSAILAAMKNSGRPMGPFGPTAIGGGLLDAADALQNIAAVPHAGDTPGPFFTTTGSIGAGDPAQTKRLLRSGGASSCTDTHDPSLTGEADQNRRYDLYGFQNITDTGQCVRADLTPLSPDCEFVLQSAGYTGAFNPASPATNVGGYAGATPSFDGYSFFMPVGAGQTFIVDVLERLANLGCSSYRLSLDSNKPFATAHPAVSGPSATGAFSTTNGTWGGSPAFSYHWQRCTAAGASCGDIPGAGAASYKVASADVGGRLRARVTATEHGQSASVSTQLTGVVPATADKTPPQTTITKGPAARTPNGKATFSFVASEAGSTFRCRIDSKPAASCSSPKTYKGLGSGKHTFKVVAKDHAGNSDPSAATRTFTVLGPQTKIGSRPKRTTHSRSAKFTFKGSQKKGSFRCKLDKGKRKKCKSPKRYKHLKKGKHTFRVYAVNKYGVKDKTPSKVTWRIR